MEHMPSGGCNEIMIALILIQLLLKLVRKFKASFWVQCFPNERIDMLSLISINSLILSENKWIWMNFVMEWGLKVR